MELNAVANSRVSLLPLTGTRRSNLPCAISPAICAITRSGAMICRVVKNTHTAASAQVTSAAANTCSAKPA